MFGQKDKPLGITKGSTTLIAKGTEVEGQLTFGGTLEVEGLIRGNIIASDPDGCVVRVHRCGEVVGDIMSPVVSVNGKVTGNIYSSKRAELVENAEVTGDVHYQVMEMVKGAQVNGSMLYSPKDAGDTGSTESEKVPADQLLSDS